MPYCICCLTPLVYLGVFVVGKRDRGIEQRDRCFSLKGAHKERRSSTYKSICCSSGDNAGGGFAINQRLSRPLHPCARHSLSTIISSASMSSPPLSIFNHEEEPH